jgi:hypothetical protein
MPGPTVKITRHFDPRALNALKKRLSDEGEAVRVGIPDDAKHEGVSTAQIAAVHEFGDPEHNIPERSFLRASIAENRGRYKALNSENLKAVLSDKMTIQNALERLGTVAAGDVKSYIRNANFEPLKAATIRRKGSSKPLIDTGQMRQSITYAIDKKGG